MEGHWTEMSPGKHPAAVEAESADKVTAVLAAAAERSADKLQAAPVDVGCVLVAAVDETVPAVAAWGVAGGPVWILGSWIGLVIQG